MTLCGTLGKEPRGDLVFRVAWNTPDYGTLQLIAPLTSSERPGASAHLADRAKTSPEPWLHRPPKPAEDLLVDACLATLRSLGPAVKVRPAGR